MPRICNLRPAICALHLIALPALAQAPAAQTDADHYTRYELLSPGSAKFRIIYEVTATTAGATKYFNPIRRGSIATDDNPPVLVLRIRCSCISAPYLGEERIQVGLGWRRCAVTSSRSPHSSR